MEKLIENSMDQAVNLTLFGSQMSKTKTSNAIIKSEMGSDVYSNVKLIGVELNGKFHQLDNPVYMILPGEGEGLKEHDLVLTEEVKKWKLKKTQISTKIELTSGTVTDLISEELLSDVSVSLKIKNATYQNGHLKCSIEIRLKVFGVRVTETVKVSINLGLNRWVTVAGVDLGVGDIKLEVKLSSLNKICARIKVCAKVGPFEKCAKATECLTF